MTTKNPRPSVRTGQADFPISREQFERRFRALFCDPAFTGKADLVDALLEVAWDAYRGGRKSPVTQKAGPAFSDPNYELSVEWLATRQAIQSAQRRHDDKSGRSRVRLICGAARNDKSCPGEMSKSFRMLQLAQQTLEVPAQR